MASAQDAVRAPPRHGALAPGRSIFSRYSRSYKLKAPWAVKASCLTPGYCELAPPVALLAEHEARMSVECCAT
jgi:hypothetical protein